MKRLCALLLLGLVLLAAVSGCRKKRSPEPDVAPVAPAPSAGSTLPAGENTSAPKVTSPAFATPESVAQYTVELREWVKRASYVPTDMAQLKSAVGAPPLPKTRPGQQLVYDPKTITVRLQ